MNMFDFLKQEFKDYVKNNFNEIVHLSIVNKNDIVFDDYRKATLRTISYFEDEIVRLKKMSRIELEQEQLKQNGILSNNHFNEKYTREKNIFEAELLHSMLRNVNLGDKGSTLNVVLEKAREKAYKNIDNSHTKVSTSPTCLQILDHQDYRQKRINSIKDEIAGESTLLSAYESQIIYLREQYAQLEEKSKNCVIHKYEVLCYNDDGIHVNEYDLDSIKFKMFDEVPDDLDYDTAYNIVYDVTQMYEGVAAEPKDIEDCLIKYDSSLKYQEIAICDGYKLTITELKG